MVRLRIIILCVALWLSILFNLERPDVLGFNVSSVVYILSAGLVVAILLFPDLGTLRTEGLLLGTTALYGVAYLLGLHTPNLTAPMIVTEIVILLVTVFIAALLSKSVAHIEQVVEGVATAADETRIYSAAEGEQVINNELFRARRFNRPVSLLVVKVEDIAELQGKPFDRVNYRTALQRRYIRNRIGQIAESVLYYSDPIAWNGDNLIICLPETSADEAFRQAKQIYDYVRGMLNLEVPIGAATFPEDGLIYSDLLEAAKNSILVLNDAAEETPEPAAVAQTAAASTANGAMSSITAAPAVNGHGAKPAGQTYAAAVEVARPSFFPVRVIQNVARFLQQDIDILPPLQYAGAAWTVATPYYNPDFLVNRLPYQSSASRQIYRRLKRVLDVLLVIVTLPLTLPVGLVIAAAIYFTDGAPVLFVQKRTGMGGHPFKMYKFRTMVRNADEMLRELNIRVNERGETVNEHGEKLENDPRITRIGRILRKTSLDELPQLWNVLMGQMSIVGPRPTSFGVDKYALVHTQRLGVKPGITGLWQIYDRGDTDFDNRLIWDIKYIDKFSLSLDLQILVRTVLKVFKDRGAR